MSIESLFPVKACEALTNVKRHSPDAHFVLDHRKSVVHCDHSVNREGPPFETNCPTSPSIFSAKHTDLEFLKSWPHSSILPFKLAEGSFGLLFGKLIALRCQCGPNCLIVDWRISGAAWQDSFRIVAKMSNPSEHQ